MTRRKRKIQLGIVLVALLFLAGWLGLRPKFWQGWVGKLVLVTNTKSQGVVIAVIDPASSLWSEIKIPGTVAVQVASELGTWPLASVWPLGVNEKKAGTLLVRTIVTNFGFPAFIWQDEATGQTNFNFGDRLRFFLFRLKNSKGPQTTIDLTETTFLKKTRLVGGEWGWRISGEMPSSLSALFPDETVLQSGPKVKIINYSGKVGLGESIGAVMETIGIKVAAIQKEEARDFDCAISGNDTRLVKRLNLVFECRDKAVEPLQAGFAVSLEIGRDFSRRF